MARVEEFATATQSTPSPLIVIVRSTGFRIASSPQLRATGAEPPVSNVRTLQSSENPALQIQIVQVIDPATGAPIQILEILFVAPQPNQLPSQSI
jgi:hypothetical protein